MPEAVVWDFDGDDGLLIKIDRSSAAGAEVYAFYFLDEECGVEDAGTADTERYEFLDWFGADHSQAFTCAADGVFETLAAHHGGTCGRFGTGSSEWTAPAWPGFIFGFEDGMGCRRETRRSPLPGWSTARAGRGNLLHARPLGSFAQCCLGCSEAGDGNPRWAARHVVQTGAVTEVDRRRVAAVLAADTHLEIGSSGSSFASCDFDEGVPRHRCRQ